MNRLAYTGVILGAAALAASMPGAGTLAGAHPARRAAVTTSYEFMSIASPQDPTFTQLLGINKAGTIVGYSGSGADAQHPNKGFLLTMPAGFMQENYPNSAQTQAVGINNQGDTAGFYVDSAGATHGFTDIKGTFATVDMPGTTFNQLLGLNNSGEQAGYYQTGSSDHPTFFPYIHQANGTFRRLPIANAQATSLNDHGLVGGFYNDAAGNSHGFLWHAGAKRQTVDYPGAASTQILGLNNLGWAVGSYTVTKKVTHGLVYNANTKTFTQVDVPGSSSTVINGINRLGWVVGFYTDAKNNTVGFAARPGQGGGPIMGPPPPPMSGTGLMSTTTTISANFNPSQALATVVLMVRVSPSTATGMVQLTDQYTDFAGNTSPSRILTGGLLSGGTFTFSTNSLLAGHHKITVTYLGDNKDASSSATLMENVAPHS
jgi:hypothetical protein